jgi:hypothetical protein
MLPRGAPPSIEEPADAVDNDGMDAIE